MDDDDGNLQRLLDMGFSRERCVQALSKTGNGGIEAAVNWLLTNSKDQQDGGHTLGTGNRYNEEGDGDGHKETGKGEEEEEDEENKGKGTDPQLQPKSLKCDDCGKILKSELDAQAHAARTKHTNFSESTEEIKPLTEEEKKEAVARLETKRLQKRAEREEKEKLEAKERERLRRKTGQEMTQLKHEMELKEAKKIAEQKKREKMEEKMAREKVREQITRDRADRAAREKAEKNNTEVTQTATPSPTVAPKKEYDTCRLQIRLFGGKTLVNTFKATETLIDVNKFILMNRTDDGTPYSLMTNFPRHVFTGEETGKTLKELGLVPSAALILTKL